MRLLGARSFWAAATAIVTANAFFPGVAFAETSNPSEQTTGVTAGEIVLGSCAPLTGQMAIRGTAVVAGGKAYFDYVNDHGGINGRKIKLMSCNDLYSADAADSCFASCLKDKVFAGTLFQGSANGVRYLKDANQAKIPMVGFSMAARWPSNAQSYCFQLRPSTDVEVAEQVDKLWSDLGCRKIAVVLQNDAYGAAVLEAATQALTKYKSAPIAVVSYPRLAENMDDGINRLRAAGPDAVILGASADALAKIVKRRGEIGTNPVCVAFSNGSDLVVGEGGKDADGVLITQFMPVLQKDSRGYKFYAKTISEYGQSKASASSLEGFMIAMAVCEGLKRAGKDLTRERFIKALESMQDFDLGFGPNYHLSYNKTDHVGLHKCIYWSTVKNGQLELVSDVKAAAKHK